MEKTLDSYIELNYLQKEEWKFKFTEWGFLQIRKNGEEKFKNIELHRMFPFEHPYKYIEVKYEEGESIGIVSDIKDFPENIQNYMKKELDRRYFSPEITKIFSIKNKYGYLYWDVETESGKCNFVMHASDNNIKLINDRYVLIQDMYGTKYKITNINNMDKSSYKKIELHL